MSLANPRRSTPATRSEEDIEDALALSVTMTLRKGSTFHHPTSPVASLDHIFVPPQLSRSRSHLGDVIDANRRRVELTINDCHEALAKKESHSISPSSKPSNKRPLRDTSLPLPRAFLDLPCVDPTMASPKPGSWVLRPHSVRRPKQASDSGLGSSIASCAKDKKCEIAQATENKKDSRKSPPMSVSALTGASSAKQMLPALSCRAFSRIHEHILRPLLGESTFNDFEALVLGVPRRIRSKEIICLRDLEKTLIFMAPENAKSAHLYLSFCFKSIQCIQASVEYISEREQVRPGDRPYTNGYFIDLKEQIYQYGRQLAAAKDKSGVTDAMDFDKNDEIRLYGGIAENGRHAELIRVRKDGSAVSIASGKPVDLAESRVNCKRSLNTQRENEEEIMRSMARRKKNASAEELAPKKCCEPGCCKEFKRPCDLKKHEKTHSRPWKCPNSPCKYTKLGWPTEKEMHRHINDRHSKNPAIYECIFKPCNYRSKRESNCKQHMEKLHGWTYIRTRTNGKKGISEAGIPMQPTPSLGSISPPTSIPVYGTLTPPRDQHQDAMVFPTYETERDWLATNGLQPDSLDAVDLSIENTSSSSSATSYKEYPPYQNGSMYILDDEDLYAGPDELAPAPMLEHDQLYNKHMPQQPSFYQAPQPYFAPQQVAPPHFSPSGQENAMLFTPNSLHEVDEGFHETLQMNRSDFQLFPTTKKSNDPQQPLFDEIPSESLGFSQASHQDIFQQLGWPDFNMSVFQQE